MKLFKSELALLAILFIGLFLRIYCLSKESIWIDEANSITLAHLNLSQIIKDLAVSNPHPPLHFVILHYWVTLFGDSEFSIRFPSVIFGFFAIFMIYKIGSLLFDKEVGILSSLILALSVFHIHYSQEARMYSLMALLTLLSVYFFIRLLERRSIIVSIGYILSSILLMYTHIYGLFIIIAQNIYIVTLFLISKQTYKVNFKRWILLQAILIILFTPWITILIGQVKLVEAGFWISSPPIRKIIGPFLTYSGSTFLFCLFLILSSVSIVTYDKIRGTIDWRDFFKSIKSYRWDIGLSNVNRIYLLLVWLLTPIILPFIISRLSTPIYITRYTIGASLAFYLLVGKGIKNIDSKYVKSAIISIIIVGSVVNVWKYYTNVNKEQWRDVAKYIDTNAEHGDLLLFNAGFCRSSFEYYSKRTDLIKKPFPEKATDVDKENIKELGRTVEGHNSVWLILAYSNDDRGLIKKTLSRSYNLLYHMEYISMSYATGKSMSIGLYLFGKK